MNSILQTEKKCAFCETTLNLERHHVLHGTANRRKAEDLGLWIWLCAEHHRGPVSPHHNANIDMGLKKAAQMAFEQSHTRDEWMREIGRNYL